METSQQNVRFPLIYSIICILDLVAVILHEMGISSIPHYLFKPLLMPALVLYALPYGSRIAHFRTLIVALICGWMGDVYLLFPYKLFFMLGLGVFLIGHILYIRLLWPEVKFKENSLAYIITAALIVIAGVLLYFILPATPAEMQLPVSVYTCTILIMTILAGARKPIVGEVRFWYGFVGACLFLFSDSMIAINKFVFPFVGANFVIMLTYLAGQYGIVRGLIKE